MDISDILNKTLKYAEVYEEFFKFQQDGAIKKTLKLHYNITIDLNTFMIKFYPKEDRVLLYKFRFISENNAEKSLECFSTVTREYAESMMKFRDKYDFKDNVDGESVCQRLCNDLGKLHCNLLLLIRNANDRPSLIKYTDESDKCVITLSDEELIISSDEEVIDNQNVAACKPITACKPIVDCKPITDCKMEMQNQQLQYYQPTQNQQLQYYQQMESSYVAHESEILSTSTVQQQDDDNDGFIPVKTKQYIKIKSKNQLKHLTPLLIDSYDHLHKSYPLKWLTWDEDKGGVPKNIHTFANVNFYSYRSRKVYYYQTRSNKYYLLCDDDDGEGVRSLYKINDNGYLVKVRYDSNQCLKWTWND